LLDKCKTQIGSRCLRRWLKQPLQDLKEIEKRLDVVECLFKDKQLINYVRNDFLRKIPDLDKLYAKFYKVHSGKKYNASLVECAKVFLNKIILLIGLSTCWCIKKLLQLFE
jgi:DNA mismatch repair protein MSH2